MTSKPLIILGPNGSGKTHIAMSIMQLFRQPAIKHHYSQAADIARGCLNDHIKLVVIEGIPDNGTLEEIWNDIRLMEKSVVFTSSSDKVTVPEGFNVIHLTQSRS
jgi:chromosomal replication initiation ATPase DnaA